MKNLWKYILGAMLLLALGYGIGRHVQPARVEIKREVQLKEVEVIKKDVVIVEKEIVRPDGTIEKERTEIDKSKYESEKNFSEKESTLIVGSKPQWKVQASTNFKNNNVAGPLYGLGVERRIIGPIFVGGFVNADKQVGLSLSWEF